MRIQNGTGGVTEGGAEKPLLQDVLAHYGCHAPHDGKYICLVHDEDNPSMNVSLREGLWHCHSCGQGGDSWTLIQKKEDLDFKSAVAYGASAGFASSAPDGSRDSVSGVLGRRRPGVSRGSGSRGSGPRSRPWTRPW